MGRRLLTTCVLALVGWAAGCGGGGEVEDAQSTEQSTESSPDTGSATAAPDAAAPDAAASSDEYLAVIDFAEAMESVAQCPELRALVDEIADGAERDAAEDLYDTFCGPDGMFTLEPSATEAELRLFVSEPFCTEYRSDLTYGNPPSPEADFTPRISGVLDPESLTVHATFDTSGAITMVDPSTGALASGRNGVWDGWPERQPGGRLILEGETAPTGDFVTGIHERDVQLVEADGRVMVLGQLILGGLDGKEPEVGGTTPFLECVVTWSFSV